MDSEPWYGVRLVYQLICEDGPAYEERILIIRASGSDDAIEQAERLSRETYESESTTYTGYAMAFNVVDEDGETLPPGVEVFSLIRKSELNADDYLHTFHDTGKERARSGP